MTKKINCFLQKKSLFLQIKIRAITILELSVTLLLSAILVAIIYNSFNIYQKLFLKFNRQSAKKSEIIRMVALISKDVYISNKIIKKSDNSFTVYYSDREINYTGQGSYLLRTTKEHTDTIHVPVVTKLYWDNAIQNLDDFPIDKIELAISINDTVMNHTFHKSYGADVYINNAE